MSTKKQIFKDMTPGEQLFTMVLVGLIYWGCAEWTQRTMDFWLTKWQGHEVHVPLWLDWLLILVLQPLAVGGNVISEILRLAIGG